MYKLIRSRRNLIGLTQFQLACEAGLSLAHIQNIESGKANPSFDVLNKIFKPLGLEFSIVPRKIDWNYLSSIGFPLAAPKMVKSKIDLVKIVRSLRELAGFLSQTHEGYERERLSFEAFLFTIKHDYPHFFEKHFENSELVLNFLPRNITGDHLKLRRLILEKIASYL